MSKSGYIWLIFFINLKFSFTMRACKTSRLSVRFIYYHRRITLNDLFNWNNFFFFLHLQNLWYLVSRFKASSACQLIGRSTSQAVHQRKRLNSNTVWLVPLTTMELAVARYVASVTIILVTLPARQVAKKYVFPVGKENTVQNVSLFPLYLNLTISSYVPYFFSCLIQ